VGALTATGWAISPPIDQPVRSRVVIAVHRARASQSCVTRAILRAMVQHTRTTLLKNP
jgi:hypothetical protein